MLDMQFDSNSTREATLFTFEASYSARFTLEY